MKTISVLGVTGSVGINTFKLLKHNKNKFRVECITAYSNYKSLAKITNILNPRFIVIGNKNLISKLTDKLVNKKIKVLFGEEGIIEAAKCKTDITINAIVGIAGLKPTYEAIKYTKVLGIANKESIIGGGKILLNRATKYSTKIIPLDSEHNAIFQILDKENIKNVRSITLTASGGPFWRKKNNFFKTITLKEALNHPNWKMGKKITIDSATMMNKFLETIEASILFGIELNKIKILIEPNSFVHGIIDYIDGTSFLITSKPDMRIAINYALQWPNRSELNFANLNFSKSTINFFSPDKKKFPVLKLKEKIIKNKYYECMLVVINSANEIAVNAFIRGKIEFLDINNVVQKTLKSYNHRHINSLKDIIEVDNLSRVLANSIINKKGK